MPRPILLAPQMCALACFGRLHETPMEIIVLHDMREPADITPRPSRILICDDNALLTDHARRMELHFQNVRTIAASDYPLPAVIPYDERPRGRNERNQPFYRTVPRNTRRRRR